MERAGLAEIFASPDPLPVSDEFRELVLSGQSTHLEVYEFCLRNSYYNFMLFDHSLFQFSWYGPNQVRYAYYPNPHVSSDQDLHKFRKYRELVESDQLSEDDFFQFFHRVGMGARVPIFRYESAPSQYNSLSHPCSHFHIGLHGENRWAIRRILTPVAFAMLIVKHYFAAEWSMGVPEGSLTGANDFEVELSQERANCQLLEDQWFSEEERNTFHFA